MGFEIGTQFIDEDVSKQGVWVDYLQGSRIKIASSNSQKYKGYLARLYRQHRLELDDSNPDNMAKIQRLSAEAMASLILLDWEGIDWPDGTKNIPYSKERGIQALLGADAFREFVTEKAATPTLFRAQIVQEAVGN